jgi:hypothetical protein
MNRMKRLLALLLSLSPLAVHANIPYPMMENTEELIVNNRILANVHGKAFSVLDVMKQMDVFLKRHYPQYLASKPARYQYYMENWKNTLNEMINTELIMADSEGKDLKITDSDIRETMQERFGPNVISTLDSLNVTYEEAKTMIYQEKVVQQMTWFKANSRALQGISPNEVKKTYKEFVLQHPPVEEWKYQVLSVRAPQADAGRLIADKAFELLSKEKKSFQDTAEALKQEGVAIQVSQDYAVTDKEMAKSHKEVLVNLATGSFSQPVSQVSRADNTNVYRIFYLKDHLRHEPPAFEKVAMNIENQLIQQAMAKETAVYASKLRQRYNFDEKQMRESLPPDFVPFILK